MKKYALIIVDMQNDFVLTEKNSGERSKSHSSRHKKRHADLS